MVYKPFSEVISIRQSEIAERKERRRLAAKKRRLAKLNKKHTKHYWRKRRKRIKVGVRKGTRCWGCKRLADKEGVVKHRPECPAIIPLEQV
jgi:hypothetical protein